MALRSNTGEALTAVTDANGDYRFASVAAGRYTITFTLSGFKKTVRPNLDVRDAADVPVDQRLEAASHAGDTVVADAGRVSVVSRAITAGAAVTRLLVGGVYAIKTR